MSKMKSSNEESLVLSKNNAKLFLVRNALDQATLKKEARLLQKERNSGERLFLKKREHLLQQQSLRKGLVQLDSEVTKWKSETNLVRELPVSPSKPRRKEIDGNNKSQTLLSSSFPLLSEGADKQSNHRSRNKPLSSLSSHTTTGSLPDIHAASNGTAGGKTSHPKQARRQESDKKQTGGLCAETEIVVEDWDELQKCRYLR
ncbi:hypothetical protein OS493_030442 [Desmophyllum pertusum]|uniref:Uncharacterized protein n=1 Tax=Desmophyllum pertusum TaxID=174260 RepID=A0A9W9YWJ6_9CNID|nr:hypothetical protein OS493_030442 [Desmophyllum pertusum]